MLISLVIPVYNAASDVAECLASILAQTPNDAEVICVDDGSTDGSAAILAEAAAHDGRVRVLQQSHTGAGAARNAGLAAAHGDWLWLVDADDRICGEAVLSALREVAKSGNPPDILLFNADEVDAKTGLRTPVPLRIELAATRKDPRWLAACGTAPWNKVFRREFVVRHRLQFQEIPRANDAAFVVAALCLAQTIRVVPSVGYLYRINAGGSLQQTNALSPFCFYDALTEIASRLKTRGAFAANESAFNVLALRMIVGNVFSLRSRTAFAQLCSFLHARGDEFGIMSPSPPHGASRFLLNAYRTILGGRLPNRTFGRIAFSVLNRGPLSFLKHAVGRVMR